MAYLVLEVEHTALRNMYLIVFFTPHKYLMISIILHIIHTNTVTSMQLGRGVLPQPSAFNDGVDPGVVCTRKRVDHAVPTAAAAA